jgi:hypothetical protein
VLAGLLRRARWGHKLHVACRGRDGRAPRYYCLTGKKELRKPSCLCFGGINAEQTYPHSWPAFFILFRLNCSKLNVDAASGRFCGGGGF